MKKISYFLLSAFALVSCSKEMSQQPGIAENLTTKVGAANPEVGGRPLSAHLTSANGVGDPDGTGMAYITVNIGQGSISYELSVSNINPATAAHIHVGPAGVNGPVVITLAAPSTGSSGGTISNLDIELLKAIIQNPENYYVNVHNPMYPGGAVRGQLSK